MQRYGSSTCGDRKTQKLCDLKHGIVALLSCVSYRSARRELNSRSDAPGRYSRAISPSVSSQKGCLSSVGLRMLPISCHVRSHRGNSWRAETQHLGARAGNRTLNLGIKSLSTLRLREDQGGSQRLDRTRIYDATVSGSLLECQGVSRSRCQIGCETPGSLRLRHRRFLVGMVPAPAHSPPARVTDV